MPQEIVITPEQKTAVIQEVVRAVKREHGKDLSDYHRAAFGPGHPTGFKVGSSSAKPVAPNRRY